MQGGLPGKLSARLAHERRREPRASFLSHASQVQGLPGARAEGRERGAEQRRSPRPHDGNAGHSGDGVRHDLLVGRIDAAAAVDVAKAEAVVARARFAATMAASAGVRKPSPFTSPRFTAARTAAPAS